MATNKEIRALREKLYPRLNKTEGRARFAKLFSVTMRTVLSWEYGTRKPQGLALVKIECLVKKHLDAASTTC